MNKLEKKLFWTLFLMLTVFVITILLIFHIQSYIQEKRGIENSLNMIQKTPYGRITDNNELEEKELIFKDDRDNPRMFMDRVIYTIELNSNNEIEKIICHSPTSTEEDIREFVESLLEKNNLKDVYIGNLYGSRYSYKYVNENTLIIVDNTNTNDNLQSSLKISIIIFIVLEIFIIVISKVITKWITKPVEVSFEKQKQFIADASHELKTPIAVIMSNLETYEVDKKQKWLDNISNETERMNHLIKNLLNLARSENDSRNNYTSNNLSKIIERQSLTFESVMFEKGISLDCDIEENIMLLSSSDELKQLISIILDNAIKHSSSNNGNIKVHLVSKNNRILLEISNKGEPIKKGEEEKIFERFYRSDASRNRNENRYGLGLAIAKNIVEKHHGSIKAYSDNGYTTFQIVFKK